MPSFNCSAVWGICGKCLTLKLQKLQNRAARIITFSNHDSDADEPIHTLGWKNLNDQRLIPKSTLMHKTLHSYTPEYIRSKFIERNNLISYNLRETESKLAIPLPRTEFYKRSFSYSGAVFWNSLPRHLRTASSLTEFKSQIRDHRL